MDGWVGGSVEGMRWYLVVVGGFFFAGGVVGDWGVCGFGVCGIGVGDWGW